MKPLIIGIAGGSASGKTTVCDILFNSLGGLEEATLIPLDCFYNECT